MFTPTCPPRRASLWVLGVLGLLLSAPPAAGQSSYEQLQTFSSLLNQIRLAYVDSVTYTQLVRAAIDGVLSSLDPHSRFTSQADAAREAAYESGALAGTGLFLDDVDDALVVAAIAPKSPAARAGISAGDRLVAIEDTSTAGLTATEAARRLVGDKGRKIRLLFERGSRLVPDTVRVRLKLDYLEPLSVSTRGMLDPTTGYLRLTGFHFKGGDEVEKAINALRGKGAKRLILDLRDNPGGSVWAAVEIASLFFPKGTLVFRTEGRARSVNTEYRTRSDGKFRDLPMLVLMDDGSASASEALAASLQDHDRALLLGRRTFGKALMQQVFPIPPQDDVVWLTVGRVVTPSGRVIQRAYHGLKARQYHSFGGRGGRAEDTSAVFRTDHGREVRGGGGVRPDIELPAPVELPPWFFAASDSGWYEAVSDSVAALLPPDPQARKQWIEATGEWQTRLVAPFLTRVRERLHLDPTLSEPLAARLGRILAHRATEVRWGAEGADEFVFRNDPGIRAAMGYWDRLGELTGASPPR